MGEKKCVLATIRARIPLWRCFYHLQESGVYLHYYVIYVYSDNATLCSLLLESSARTTQVRVFMVLPNPGKA